MEGRRVIVTGHKLIGVVRGGVCESCECWIKSRQ